MFSCIQRLCKLQFYFVGVTCFDFSPNHDLLLFERNNQFHAAEYTNETAANVFALTRFCCYSNCCCYSSCCCGWSCSFWNLCRLRSSGNRGCAGGNWTKERRRGQYTSPIRSIVLVWLAERTLASAKRSAFEILSETSLKQRFGSFAQSRN